MHVSRRVGRPYSILEVGWFQARAAQMSRIDIHREDGVSLHPCEPEEGVSLPRLDSSPPLDEIGSLDELMGYLATDDPEAVGGDMLRGKRVP